MNQKTNMYTDEHINLLRLAISCSADCAMILYPYFAESFGILNFDFKRDFHFPLLYRVLSKEDSVI